MYLITFEPGDGTSYRILYGQLPGRGLVPFYTVFGIAEGSSEPGAWYAFDADPRCISFDTFERHIAYRAEHELILTAWRAWLALTDQEDDEDAADELPDWREDWRDRLLLLHAALELGEQPRREP